MRIFKNTFVAGATLLAALVGTQSAMAQKCGTTETITIAEMTWLSASMEAHVVKKILIDGYGCNAELVPGDTVPTATSMLTKNKPMIAPELWVSTAATIWSKIQDKGNVYKASDIFMDGGKEGWWIPDYVAQQNPGLKSILDLKDHAHLFTEVASDGKGRLYGCPPGWGCEIITNNLYKALNLGNHGFESEPFSSGSGANLKASLARKVTRKQPVIGYYWGPTAVVGKYNLVRLAMPPHDATKFKCLTDKNCTNPQVTGWAKGEVAVAVVTSLKSKAPAVAKMLGKMTYPNEVMNSVLAWADEQKSETSEVATYFLKKHPEVWNKWVPADVANRIKSKL